MDRWDQLRNEAPTMTEGSPIAYILAKLLKEIELIIFKTDDEGNPIYKEGKKWPIINVMGILTSLFKLVGKIAVLYGLWQEGLVAPKK